MAYDATKPANNDFLADFPPQMREQLRAIVEDAIVNALKLQGLEPGNIAGNIPVSNGNICLGLNAEKLGGNLATAFAAAGHGHSEAAANSDGFMSNTDKTKLDGISAGAEVNQNAFANVLVGEESVQADSKTDTLELVAGANISLTPDAVNDRITIAVSGKVGNAAVADTASTCSGNAATATNAANHIEVKANAHVAAAITAEATGNITATNVQAAIAELDTKKINTSDVVKTAAANKILALNNNAELPANITGNAATATKLAVARKINGVGFTGDADIMITQVNGKDIVTVDHLAATGDGIVEGLELTLGSGLSVEVSPGRCNINQSVHTLENAATVMLSANKSALIYAAGSNGAISIGKAETSYPDLDDYHIARYIFNTKENNIVPDTSPSKNDLTITGSCEIVGGLCDFAIKTDGATAYMTSAAIPAITTSSIFEVTHVFTFHDRYIDAIISSWSQVYFRSYGGLENTSLYVKNNSDLQTDHVLKSGETYALTLQYDGIFTHIYLNGKYLTAYATSPAAATQKIWIGSHNDTKYKSKSVHHYYEIRVGKLRTPAEIGEMVNKMGIVTEYVKHEGEYPLIPVADRFCEWKFNDPVSDAAVADSFNNANLTFVGTFKNVNSPVGLGTALSTNGGYGKKDDFTIPPEYTFIFVGVLHDVTSEIGFFGMYNGNWWINCIKNGKLAVHNMAGAWKFTNIDMAAYKNKPVFIVFTFKNRVMEFYLNNEQYECIHTDYSPPATAGTLNVLGVGKNTASRFFGEANYALFIPRALTPSEINSYYFKLLNPSTRDITDNLQPADTVALGFVKSGSEKIVDSFLTNPASGFGIESYFSGSRQADLPSSGFYAGPADYQTGSGNKERYIMHSKNGVVAGTYTLQAILQSLVNRSHGHQVEKNLYNCNCDCNCGGNN
jgi:hypothetical protein